MGSACMAAVRVEGFRVYGVGRMGSTLGFGVQDFFPGLKVSEVLQYEVFSKVPESKVEA